MAKRRQPSPRDTLYAEWKALDDARTKREDELEAIIEAPAEVVGGVCEGRKVSTANNLKACQCASHASLKPTCPCGNPKGFVDGLYTSVSTGRNYEPHVTPEGLAFGFERRTKFVMVSAGGYTIERGASGRPNVGRYVDELAAKLAIRGALVNEVKSYVYRPEDREALDAMLLRWFRWPSEWPRVQRHIREVTDGIRFKPTYKDTAIRIFRRRHFRATWDA